MKVRVYLHPRGKKKKKKTYTIEIPIREETSTASNRWPTALPATLLGGVLQLRCIDKGLRRGLWLGIQFRGHVGYLLAYLQARMHKIYMKEEEEKKGEMSWIEHATPD